MDLVSQRMLVKTFRVWLREVHLMGIPESRDGN